ncbi:MAG TPA: M23 family metallopeptidase [Candidatus Dormibacteraeota bacterium]|nr:M23 family metallopeptidase [Candidatus Dormibacteraeota bacterium]
MRTSSRWLRLLLIAAPAAAIVAVFSGPITRPGGIDGSRSGGDALGGQVAQAAVLAPRASGPPLSAEDSRLRRGEPLTPRPLADLTGYVWPLPHGRITQPFGPSRGNSFLVHGVETHDGVDLATFCGDRVVAAHGGVVLAAGREYQAAIGWRGDLAPYIGWLDAHHGWADLPITVVIDDGDTYRSIYAHFARIVVAVGQRVSAGQLLGYEGRTGHATGCHVHFGLFSPYEPGTWALQPELMRRYLLPPAETARVDPLLVLPARPRPLGPDAEIRLAPVDTSEAL